MKIQLKRIRCKLCDEFIYKDSDTGQFDFTLHNKSCSKSKLKTKKNTNRIQKYGGSLYGFYQDCIKSCSHTCFECGKYIPSLEVGNIAHLFPKTKYPFIAKRKEFVIALCDHKSENQCHRIFDFDYKKRVHLKSYKKMTEMLPLAMEMYNNCGEVTKSFQDEKSSFKMMYMEILGTNSI